MSPLNASLVHVQSVCQAGYYHLRNIYRIKDCLNRQALEILVHSVVSSRLDYCNALLAGLPAYLIGRLQIVQNCAARLITGVRRREHITPVLHSLHWLPVQCRIDFKVLLLVFKCLNGKAPAYLRDMLQFKDTRYTRSMVDDKLAVPRTKCSTFGDRAFSVYGPAKWNNLPRDIRYCADLDDFKTKLKTYLFIEYYSSH